MMMTTTTTTLLCEIRMVDTSDIASADSYRGKIQRNPYSNHEINKNDEKDKDLVHVVECECQTVNAHVPTQHVKIRRIQNWSSNQQHWKYDNRHLYTRTHLRRSSALWRRASVRLLLFRNEFQNKKHKHTRTHTRIALPFKWRTILYHPVLLQYSHDKERKWKRTKWQPNKAVKARNQVKIESNFCLSHFLFFKYVGAAAWIVYSIHSAISCGLNDDRNADDDSGDTDDCSAVLHV